MDDEIQLISDGDGLTVIGKDADVKRFLASEGLTSKNLGLHRLKSVCGTGAAAAQAASEIAANSAHWVQLTPKSAHLMKKYKLMKGSTSDVGRAVLTGKGRVKGILEISRTPRSFLTNPALLSGAAGLRVIA